MASPGYSGTPLAKKLSLKPEVILPDTDLVDVKVCAVDGMWSGLKQKSGRTGARTTP
mgnify:CR=1 FL=1